MFQAYQNLKKLQYNHFFPRYTFLFLLYSHVRVSLRFSFFSSFHFLMTDSKSPIPSFQSILNKRFFSESINRYFSLFVSFAVTLHTGTLYCFGAYAVELQTYLDTSDVAILSAIAHAGFLSNILLGIFYGYFGYEWTMAVSAVFAGVGYLALVVTNNYLAYGIILYFVGFGLGGLQMAVVIRSCENFPLRDRGFVMGLLFGGLALAALIWMTLYLYVFKSRLIFLFLVLGISTLSFSTLAFFMGDSVPAVKPTFEEKDVRFNNSRLSIGTEVSEDDYYHVDITGFELLRSPFFWLMFALEFFGYGVSLAWKSYMGLALKDYPETKIQMLYTLIAVNASARFIVGYASDYTIRWIARPVYQLLVFCFLGLGCLTFVLKSDMTGLWIANCFIGFGYGGMVCMINTIVSIVYGHKHYGFNNGFLHLAGGAGGILITEIGFLLASSSKCSENSFDCYRISFIFNSSLIAVAIVIATIFIFMYPPAWLLPENCTHRKDIEHATAHESVPFLEKEHKFH